MCRSSPWRQLSTQVVFEFISDGKDLVNDNSTGSLNALPKANVKLKCPSLFANLLPDCKPIATKSYRYNSSDQKFINNEIQRWYSEKIIKPNQSPWRAQVLVVKRADNGDEVKKRLCIDYSKTMNLYTLLDAYPIPQIDDMVNNLAKYKLFTMFDLKSVYHQIPICESDKPHTAFEACRKILEFNPIHLG